MNNSQKLIQTIIVGTVGLAGFLLLKLTKIVTQQVKEAKEGGPK